MIQQISPIKEKLVRSSPIVLRMMNISKSLLIGCWYCFQIYHRMWFGMATPITQFLLAFAWSQRRLLASSLKLPRDYKNFTQRFPLQNQKKRLRQTTDLGHLPKTIYLEKARGEKGINPLARKSVSTFTSEIIRPCRRL